MGRPGNIALAKGRRGRTLVRCLSTYLVATIGNDSKGHQAEVSKYEYYLTMEAQITLLIAFNTLHDVGSR